MDYNAMYVYIYVYTAVYMIYFLFYFRHSEVCICGPSGPFRSMDVHGIIAIHIGYNIHIYIYYMYAIYIYIQYI
jgi:hypothetical protein